MCFFILDVNLIDGNTSQIIGEVVKNIKQKQWDFVLFTALEDFDKFKEALEEKEVFKGRVFSKLCADHYIEILKKMGYSAKENELFYYPTHYTEERMFIIDENNANLHNILREMSKGKGAVVTGNMVQCTNYLPPGKVVLASDIDRSPINHNELIKKMITKVNHDLYYEEKLDVETLVKQYKDAVKDIND